MFSVVILTLNEEKALPGCLESLRDCDDIVVLDSGSADGTAALAERAGARVFSRPFDSFAGQRNHADGAMPFRHAWVFHLDADERMTPELAAECRRAAERTDLDGFRAAPRMIYKGRWLPHCTDYPAYQARFVRARAFRFIQVGHGQREAPGMRVENLRANYLHDMSIYGRDAWLEKHRRYAREEAAVALAGGASVSLRELVSRDRLVRRRAMKRAALGLPLRPAFRFLYQYGLRRGFLDGPQGLEYCLLLARYEGFVAGEIAKLKVSSPGARN